MATALAGLCQANTAIFQSTGERIRQFFRVRKKKTIVAHTPLMWRCSRKASYFRKLSYNVLLWPQKKNINQIERTLLFSCLGLIDIINTK